MGGLEHLDKICRREKVRIKILVFMIFFTSVVLIQQIPITTAELHRYPDIKLEFKPYGWGEVEQRINKITVGQRLVLEVKIRNTGEDSITLDSSGVRLSIYVEGPRGFEEEKHWPPYIDHGKICICYQRRRPFSTCL